MSGLVQSRHEAAIAREEAREEAAVRDLGRQQVGGMMESKRSGHGDLTCI
jgi:hypothetical protein